MSSPAERIAIVSDEAAERFATAAAICVPLGVRKYELRSLSGKRVPFVEEAAIEEVEETVRARGLEIIGISPGFGKCRVEDLRAETELAAGLDQAFRLLDRLFVRRLTVFSYLRPSDDLDRGVIPVQAIELLSRAAERCRRQGIEMLIENSASCWGDTGVNLARIARAAGVRVTWDPANAQASGEMAYPEGYACVRGLVAHLHCKDWAPAMGLVDIGAGVVPVAEQIAGLEKDGYSGCYCVEPHQWTDREGASRRNVRRLLEILEWRAPA